MIKICSPQLGISPISSMGGEIYDFQTLKGFTKKGFKVFVYLPRGRNYDKSLRNFKVSYAPIKHVFPPWLFSFLMLPYLFRLYRREKFDVIRVHSPRFLGFGVFIFHLFYPHVPILASAVTVDKPSYLYPIEKWIYQNSKAIIVQSKYMKNFISKKYSLSKKLIHITYGGHAELSRRWKRKPKEAGSISKHDKIIVFMGALIERKNPKFALDIFLEVKKSIPNCKMIFIGTGKQDQDLKKRVRELIMNEVIFIDKAYGEEKAFWFSRMDLFLVPSFDEGFGLVATEAMSFNKVVVASDKAAFPEIIDNSINGYCLKLDKKIWIENIVKVLSDPIMRNNIGKAAGVKVRKDFNWGRTYKLNAEVVRSMA